MSKQTIPQQILGDALAKIAPFNKTHVDLYTAAKMSAIMFSKHWNGKTTYMKPDTESKIELAVKELCK